MKQPMKLYHITNVPWEYHFLHHNYYYQVQQQLFTLKERKFCDFVVCGIDSEKKAHVVKECIYPDAKH